jgi:hypothetical protein
MDRRRHGSWARQHMPKHTKAIAENNIQTFEFLKFVQNHKLLLHATDFFLGIFAEV